MSHRTSPSRPIAAGLLAALFTGLCLSLSTAHARAAVAAPRVLLLDRTLAERDAGLVALDAQTLTLADARGRVYTVDPAGFLAIISDHTPADQAQFDPEAFDPSDPDAADPDARIPRGRPLILDPDQTNPTNPDQAPPPTGTPADRAPWTLRLTDGQVLPGAILSAGNPDTLTFDADRLGPITVDLERVAALTHTGIAPRRTPNAATTEPATAQDDTVRLANGDIARGFVLALSPDAVEIETADGIRVFAADVVAAVTLANPTVPAPGPFVTLFDGTVLAATPAAPPPATTNDGTTPTANCVLIAPSLINDQTPPAAGPDPRSASAADTIDRTICLDAADVRSIELPERSITPLAAIAPDRIVPAASRRRTDPPSTQPDADAALAAHILLPGPMTVSWPLPDDASAIVFDARLGATIAAENTPPGRWSSAILRVTVRRAAGDNTVAEHALDGDGPEARIAAALPGAGEPGRRLIIELDPGAYGPIQDRVLLVRPIILGSR